MPNPVPLRRKAKDDPTPLHKGNFALMLEAMDQLTADPDRWDRPIEPLEAAPPAQLPPPSARPGVVQSILQLEREGEGGPCFAYVIPARALPGGADDGAIELADGDQSYALVFPAVEETGRLWVSIRDSFGLTPAEIRLASRLRDG